ncbi:cupin domain-containing protein [uncultured Roseobacter sp.]|uniref:cupin domain-containing protein n=1 Tax=uncultured Roseobacter sp. TaxID=114847 RepID=UPI0026060B67|nr:cupin domain-containing protein [uncultured Roseobacter sp.]
MDVISTQNAPHHKWQSVCDAWPLVDQPGLSVKEEQMPPGAAETLHSHCVARQFFYVLQGCLTIEAQGRALELTVGQGTEVPPGVAHRARNTGGTALRFLVVSSPSTAGDRHELPDQGPHGGATGG